MSGYLEHNSDEFYFPEDPVFELTMATDLFNEELLDEIKIWIIKLLFTSLARLISS